MNKIVFYSTQKFYGAKVMVSKVVVYGELYKKVLLAYPTIAMIHTDSRFSLYRQRMGIFGRLFDAPAS